MINLIIISLKFVQYDKVDQVWNVLEKQMADEVLWTKLSPMGRRSVNVSENTKLKANLRDRNEKIVEDAQTLLLTIPSLRKVSVTRTIRLLN